MQAAENDNLILFPNDIQLQLEEAEDFKIHLRVQKRSARKSITVVEGLPDHWNAKKLTRAFKKQFSCNGAVKVAKEEDGGGNVIQLSGDQRQVVVRFLIAEGLCTASQCVMHGY